MSNLTESVIELGRLSLMFGRVDRLTYHEDGSTPESDTDHTVMLGLVGCAFAHATGLPLDLGKVAQYALVHDLVEVYAGDTNTLRMLSQHEKNDKARREAAALLRIAEEFSMTLPWICTTIAEYETRCTPEARYVKALDKLLPKITHVLNGLITIHEQGMSQESLECRYDAQLDELWGYASDFPALFDLRTELVTAVMSEFPVTSSAP